VSLVSGGSPRTCPVLRCVVLTCITLLHLQCVFPTPLFPIPSGIIFYAIGIPAFAMYLLWRNKDVLDSASFRERYAFLYDGYDVTPGKGRYLWEAVVLLRKIGIAVVSVAITEPFLQIYAAVVLVTVFLCLQVSVCALPAALLPCPLILPRVHLLCRVVIIGFLSPRGSYDNVQVAVRPFSTKEMNSLETGSLVTLWFTLMASILFWRVHDVEGGGANAITAVVLLVNFAMLAVFAAAIVSEGLVLASFGSTVGKVVHAK
jgi:hypothetical protein